MWYLVQSHHRFGLQLNSKVKKWLFNITKGKQSMTEGGQNGLSIKRTCIKNNIYITKWSLMQMTDADTEQKLEFYRCRMKI